MSWRGLAGRGAAWAILAGVSAVSALGLIPSAAMSVAPMLTSAPPRPERPWRAQTVEWTRWLTMPTRDDVSAAYPRRLRRAGRNGYALLSCRVGADGRLVACGIADELPSGEGVGRAALSLARRYRMDPVHDGASTVGWAVRVPVRFSDFPDVELASHAPLPMDEGRLALLKGTPPRYFVRLDDQASQGQTAGVTVVMPMSPVRYNSGNAVVAVYRMRMECEDRVALSQMVWLVDETGKVIMMNGPDFTPSVFEKDELFSRLAERVCGQDGRPTAGLVRPEDDVLTGYGAVLALARDRRWILQ